MQRDMEQISLFQAKPNKMAAKGGGEVKEELLRLRQQTRVKRYFDIKLEDYLYKERIADIRSDEEKVRQWMLKEMIGNYKYPAELVDVEYKPDSFSGGGAVDIAVSIYTGSNRVPYVFIITKALFSGLQDGLDELKSYMRDSGTCKFGIVTDGREFVIIDRDYHEVDDIPACSISMLPPSIESYSYIDFKHNREYLFEMDEGGNSSLCVKYGDEEQEYSMDSLKTFNIYSGIAAGNPMYMSDDMEGSFNLPAEWFKSSGNYFILNVSGDSMKGAGIENGDMVVIRRQQTAENRDIVAAAIDESATLKRYMKKGGTVLLMPENDKYEPIRLTAGEASIIGVAVGVIKRKN